MRPKNNNSPDPIFNPSVVLEPLLKNMYGLLEEGIGEAYQLKGWCLAVAKLEDEKSRAAYKRVSK